MSLIIRMAEAPDLNGSATTIKHQANYTQTLDLTKVSGYPKAPGGIPTFTVTSYAYNGLAKVTVSGSTITLVADDTSNSEDDIIIISVEDMANYNDGSIIIKVAYTDKTPANITGITAASSVIYNGQAQRGYVSTPTSGYTGEYETNYVSTGDTSYASAAAPTSVGSYAVTLAVPKSNANYSGSAVLNFTINKASITVTADGQTIAVDAKMPTYTATTKGLAHGVGITQISFAGGLANTSTKGIYEIRPSGGTIVGGNNSNYNIVHQNGTLTITLAMDVVDTAIAIANTAKKDIAVGAGPETSIASGIKFVTEDEMKALTDANATSTEAKSTAGTTAKAQAAATALNNAVAAFTSAVKTGTNKPTTATIKPHATTDKNGNTRTEIIDSAVQDAISKAQWQAQMGGTLSNGITLAVTLDVAITANSLTAKLPRAALDRLIATGVNSLSLSSDFINLQFNLEALKQMQAQSTGELTMKVARQNCKNALYKGSHSHWQPPRNGYYGDVAKRRHSGKYYKFWQG